MIKILMIAFVFKGLIYSITKADDASNPFASPEFFVFCTGIEE